VVLTFQDGKVGDTVVTHDYVELPVDLAAHKPNHVSLKAWLARKLEVSLLYIKLVKVRSLPYFSDLFGKSKLRSV
jgi:hypothetical protein